MNAYRNKDLLTDLTLKLEEKEEDLRATRSALEEAEKRNEALAERLELSTPDARKRRLKNRAVACLLLAVGTTVAGIFHLAGAEAGKVALYVCTGSVFALLALVSAIAADS